MTRALLSHILCGAACLVCAQEAPQCKSWCTRDPLCTEGFSLEVHTESFHGDVCRKDDGSKHWRPPLRCERTNGAPWSVKTQSSEACRLCPEGFILEVHTAANHANICRKDDGSGHWKPLLGCKALSAAPFAIHISDSQVCRVGSVLSTWSEKCAWSDCGACAACSGSVAPTTAPTEAPAGPSGSPVGLHGHLSVQGNRIVDMNGQPVRLRGMSFFWSQWESEFYNANVVQWLAADWNVQLLRIPMAVESEDGGYLDFPERERTRVETVVDAAIELGIYVIIDWHDHRAQDHVEQAKVFFGAMAEKYGRHANVLFEPYNEPAGTTLGFWMNTVKPYHESIVSEIRHHSNNIIVLGTPMWSQGMDIASQNPVAGTNLAYTLHFYAGDVRHAAIRARAQTALDNGLALVATEWGTCHWNAEQVPALGLDEARIWLEFLAANGISDANWAISDKEESCSVLEPAACPEGRWTSNVLTQAGTWIRDSIRADSPSWFQGSLNGPSECAAALEQCGGRSHCGPTCCVAGYQCVVQNEWWSDCQPVQAGGRRLVVV